MAAIIVSLARLSLGSVDAPENHGECGSSISSTAAPISSTPSLSPFHPSFIHGLSRNFVSIHFINHTKSLLLHFEPDHPNPSKCLPKLPKRSPPLAARPQPEKRPLRRRKLARRPPRLPARRKSETRLERRRTHRTSTKVCISVCYA